MARLSPTGPRYTEGGQRRHQVAVQNPTNTPDGDGGVTQSWAAASPSPVWVAIEPATPRTLERMVGSTIDAKVTHVVSMPYHSGVSTLTRLVFGSRHLQVRGVQNVEERNIELRLACEELV